MWKNFDIFLSFIHPPRHKNDKEAPDLLVLTIQALDLLHGLVRTSLSLRGGPQTGQVQGIWT